MSPKIGTYCRNNSPQSLQSQYNNLWIEYHFENSSNGRGFSLNYEPVISGNIKTVNVVK